MSTMIERYRARRTAARQREAMDRALSVYPSQAMRHELRAMLSRD